MNINIKIILLFLLFYIKCEDWYDEVNGHRKDASESGYAGSLNNPFTDFYLCSERKYRVHFLDDDNDTWTEEFTACQPVGVGRYIDGITISGGNRSSARVKDEWEWPDKTGYDIYNSSLYSGILGIPIRGFYTYGDEYYRSGIYLGNSSNEKEVAKRVIYNIFQKNYTFNYENETKVFKDSKTNITILLLNTSKINFEGKIMVKIDNGKISNSNYKHFINNNLIKHINEIIGTDFNIIKKSFENLFIKSMNNSNIAVNFNWLEKKIEIDVASKIIGDHYAYRGGFRINIYLNDEDFELLLIVKKMCKFMLSYSGKKIDNSIMTLLSDFDSFKKTNEIMNYLENYSKIAETAIFFKIISGFI